MVDAHTNEVADRDSGKDYHTGAVSEQNTYVKNKEGWW